ncbi:MAG: PAS domain S-box protein [Cytophagaceae bacterium]|nr:PAS domain S-box protein [Cytophagaceae bacterium]
MNSKVLPSKLVFEHVPAYASFLLENKLTEYAKMQLTYSIEENTPLLKFFSKYSEKELLDLGKKSTEDLLTAFASNQVEKFIADASANYIKNNLTTVEREEVLAEDITILSLIRRKSLRFFLSSYTTDIYIVNQISEEIDRFSAANDAAAFDAFLEIQKEKMHRIYEELQQKQEDLLEAQELTEMGSFLWNMKDGSSSHTPGVMQIFEMEEASSLDSFMDYVHKEDRVLLKKAIDSALTNDGIYECEYRYIKNHTEKRIWSRGLVAFEHESPVSMKGIVMDITHKYLMVEQLRQSEQLNKQAQAITHIGNWIWEMSTGEMYWSDELYRIYGLEPQAEIMTFERWFDMIHPDDREKRLSEVKKSMSTLEVSDYTMRITAADGKVKVLCGKGEVITDRSRKRMKLVGSCQDVTTEFNLNKELKEKEDYLKQLINNAPDAIIVVDKSSTISLWNPKTEEIFGWSAEEVMGKDLSEFLIPLQNRESYTKELHRYLDTGVTRLLNRTMEVKMLNKKNKEFDVALTISQSMQNGKILFIAFLRDITKQKQIKLELQNLNASLESKNSELELMNKELESFNYVASHDLKEPLRKIQIFAHRILEKGSGEIPHATVDYFNKIITASSRMQLLIEDLLIFSQTTAGKDKFERVDLNEVLTEVLSMLSTAVEEKKALIEYGVLPVVKAIPFQMQQLFLNLISNAIKYSNEGVPPSILVAVRPVKGLIGQPMVLEDAAYYEFKVQDNGIGFSEEYSEKIFELFQRLHNKDKYFGTGIGLAICKKILHNHNGFIRAQSEVSKGSTFCFYLPKE